MKKGLFILLSFCLTACGSCPEFDTPEQTLPDAQVNKPYFVALKDTYFFSDRGFMYGVKISPNIGITTNYNEYRGIQHTEGENDELHIQGTPTQAGKVILTFDRFTPPTMRACSKTYHTRYIINVKE